MLAKALAEKNEVQVISFKRQYPKWLYPGKSDKDPSSSYIKVDASFLLDPLNPISWNRTIHEIEHFCPEKIVIPWWTTFWGPAFGYITHRINRKGIPVVFVIHNIYPHEPHFFDRYIVKSVLRQGSTFIAQSERERDKLLDLLPTAQILLCAHPVYGEFGKRIQKLKARELLGLPSDVPVLLFFGIVRPYKGLKYLLQALGENELAGIKPYLLVAGEIWEGKKEYLKQIQSLGISDHVRLEDRYIPNEELPVYFSAADIFVAPYIGGTQSGALKMAIGFGMPVIATDIIVEKSINEANHKVFKVQSANSSCLAKVIAQVLTSSNCQQLNQNVRENNWQSLIQSIID